MTEIDNHIKVLCKFGCGLEATYQNKDGTYCCSSHPTKCPVNRKKNSKIYSDLSRNKISDTLSNRLEINNPDNILCKFGCGNVAKYQFSNGNYCCSSHVGICLGKQRKIKRVEIERLGNINNVLCKYGCGQIGKFLSKTLKEWYCSEHYSKCPTKKIEMSKTRTGLKLSKESKEKLSSTFRNRVSQENLDNILCKFDCGQIGKFLFKDGSWCCHKHSSQCPRQKTQMSKSQKGLKKPDGYGERMAVSKKGKKLYSLEKLKSKPENKLFFQEEEIIEDPITGDFLGHCKFYDCKNSKEKGGWFVLKPRQLEFRRFSINNSTGNENYFYCSPECKDECPVFGRTADELIRLDMIESGYIKNPYYTSSEYNIWRNIVLKQQLIRENILENRCEICHSTEKIRVHHEVPSSVIPDWSLDLSNGLILCRQCHDKYGHKKGTECSTGNLARRIKTRC